VVFGDLSLSNLRKKTHPEYVTKKSFYFFCVKYYPLKKREPPRKGGLRVGG
jgi:hypothetical protein